MNMNEFYQIIGVMFAVWTVTIISSRFLILKSLEKENKRKLAEAEENAKLEQERLEKERLESAEKERVEKERIKKEKLEADKKAQIEQERIEQERIESEKKAQIEKERLEKEHLAAEKQKEKELQELKTKKLAEKERERLRLEIEKKAKIEKEKREKEKLEAERVAKAEKERLEKERREAERVAKEEKERLEKERLEAERVAQKEKSRLEKEKREAEKRAKEEKERLEKELVGKTFEEGLEKTQKGFFGKLKTLFAGDKELDEDLLDELEELLLTSDIGPRTADKLFEKIKEGMDKKSIKDVDSVMSFIKEEIFNMMNIPFEDKSSKKPYVILFIGVNGSGKTTTIGKLSSQYVKEGKKVLLIAGDTFRAAAVEQLEVWSQRAGTLFHSGKDKQDPSSVIFDGVKKGIKEEVDVIIIDTSGRLHTDKKLMAELEKIKRTVNKAYPDAPHDTFLVLDSTNGQNAIFQAKYFNEAMDMTGIVLTKLDGTAKGGVIIGICDTYNIPVKYVGIGEGINDLKKMDVKEFVNALFPAN